MYIRQNRKGGGVENVETKPLIFLMLVNCDASDFRNQYLPFFFFLFPLPRGLCENIPEVKRL